MSRKSTRVKELKSMPVEMAPFLDVLEKIHVDFADGFHKPQQKTVGTFCIMVPEELVYFQRGLCRGHPAAETLHGRPDHKNESEKLRGVAAVLHGRLP